MVKLEKIIIGTVLSAFLALGTGCSKQEQQPLILKTQVENHEVWEIKSRKYGEEPLTAQNVCPSVLNYFFNRPLKVGPSGQSGSSYPKVSPIFPIGRSGQSRGSLKVGSSKISYVGTIDSSEIPKDYEVCGN